MSYGSGEDPGLYDRVRSIDNPTMEGYVAVINADGTINVGVADGAGLLFEPPEDWVLIEATVQKLSSATGKSMRQITESLDALQQQLPEQGLLLTPEQNEALGRIEAVAKENPDALIGSLEGVKLAGPCAGSLTEQQIRDILKVWEA